MIADLFSNFQKNNRTGFIPYLVAGYPNNKLFEETLYLLDELGSDLIEIGIPFSDPIAEGKTIEYAHHKSLESGFNYEDLFKITREFKEKSNTPVIAMGYTNSFINPSPKEFSKKLKLAKFDGILVVDLPYQEKEILDYYKHANLEFIQLIAPTSKNKTIIESVKNEPSLIYYITQRGVTGLNNIDFSEAIIKLKNIRKITDTPIITGFGIREPEQVRKFKNYTDGIVVGSFLIEKFSSSNSIREISNSIKPLIDELKNE
tara:strand:+ start:9 stop:788 length:780 start_codon:yes stop_codon:yes gene_type:complete